MGTSCVPAAVQRAAEKKGLPVGEPADHALGRSRGGFSTKLHVAVDRHGIPLGLTLTAGQKLEFHTCPQLLESVSLPRGRGGRPRRRPKVLVGDKGYNARQLLAYLHERGIATVIPRYSNQKIDPDFDRATYRQRNIVERAVGWLKNFRRLATRFEKYAMTFLGIAKLAAIRRMLRLFDSSNRT
jgi:transposase